MRKQDKLAAYAQFYYLYREQISIFGPSFNILPVLSFPLEVH